MPLNVFHHLHTEKLHLVSGCLSERWMSVFLTTFLRGQNFCLSSILQQNSQLLKITARTEQGRLWLWFLDAGAADWCWKSQPSFSRHVLIRTDLLLFGEGLSLLAFPMAFFLPLFYLMGFLFARCGCCWSCRDPRPAWRMRSESAVRVSMWDSVVTQHMASVVVEYLEIFRRNSDINWSHFRL